MGAGSSSRSRLSTADSTVFSSSSSSSSSALPSPGPGPYQVIGRAAGHRNPAVPLTIDEEGKVDAVATEAGGEQHSPQLIKKSVSHDLSSYSSSPAKNGLNSRGVSATKAGSRSEHGQVQPSVWEWVSGEDSDDDADPTGSGDEAQALVSAIRAAARLAGGSLKEALSSVSKDGRLAADDFVSALWDWVRIQFSRPIMYKSCDKHCCKVLLCVLFFWDFPVSRA
jgi:hypothetical protein